MARPSAGAVGRSLYECTAKSISFAMQRVAQRGDEHARRRAAAPGAVERSPAVTISTSSTAPPVAAVSASATSPRLGQRQRAAPGAEAERVVPVIAVLLESGTSADAWSSAGVRRHRQVEQLAQQRGVLVAAGLGGELAHPHGRRVQQPLHDPVHGVGHVGPLLVGEVGAALGQPAQLGGDHLVGPGPQGGHGRRDLGAAQPGEERLDLGGDDRSAAARLGGGRLVGERARRAGRCRSRVDAGQLGDLGRDVARHGQVEDDQRARPARRPSAAATSSAVSTGSVDAVAADHEVHSGQRVGQLGERRPRSRRAARPAGRPGRRRGW